MMELFFKQSTFLPYLLSYCLAQGLATQNERAILDQKKQKTNISGAAKKLKALHKPYNEGNKFCMYLY